MSRGLVVALTPAQRRDRMLYLAGELSLDKLAGIDHAAPIPSGYPVVNVAHHTEPVLCPDLYYLLEDYNGGKAPRARDPADRWRKPGGTTWNRTADCIGGMSWAGGWDRFQPSRFAHLYRGWINTDSIRMDARGPARCFRRIDRPEPGCYVVYASGSGGHPIGHIGGVVNVPAEYAPTEREWWQAMGVVDVAARAGRANRRTTGLGWYGTDAWFVVTTMTA